MSESNSKNYSAFKTLKRLLSLSKGYIPWYASLCLAAVLRSGVGILDTESFRRMINGATSLNLQLLKSGLILGIAALLMGVILDFVLDYYGEVLNFVSTRKLQSSIAKKLTRIQMNHYEKLHSGDLIDRLDNCANSAQTGMNNNTRTILEKVMVIILSLAYLTYLNSELMISTIIFMLLLPLLVNPLSKILRKLYDERQKLRAEKDSFVQDTLQGGEVVRSFGLSSKIAGIYHEKYKKFLRLVKRLLKFEGMMMSVHFVVILGGDFFILGFGAYMVSKGRLNVGDVLSFLIMFERIMDPISRLASIWPEFQVSISSANKVFEVLDLPEEIHSERESSIDLPHTGADIELREISFSYQEDRSVLKNVSFRCGVGKVTALVGPSGSGKSTLLKLLLRLYEPQGGNILSNGQSIHELSPQGWRKHIAYVSQDALLFSGTIYENITYGTPHAVEKEVYTAAQKANIHEFILSTPEGYQTKIGEQGIRLSGGEKQRIAIARAILRNPSVLILDEPTSALDSENERIIQTALMDLMKGRTTLIVAHRLSTIQDADQILYLEKGRIQEQGRHQELMEQKGKYFSMVEKMHQTSQLSMNALEEEGMVI